MFEVKCIVGDKKLIEVLHLLDGHTLEPPVVLPVKGAVATKTNGHAVDVPATPNAGSSVETVRRFIHGRKSVTSSEMRLRCEALGLSKNGYSYALHKLLEEGALKKTKEPRVYEVVR